MDIQMMLDDLVTTRDDWSKWKHESSYKEYREIRLKIEAEFTRLRLVEAAYMDECGSVDEE